MIFLLDLQTFVLPKIWGGFRFWVVLWDFQILKDLVKLDELRNFNFGIQTSNLNFGCSTKGWIWAPCNFLLALRRIGCAEPAFWEEEVALDLRNLWSPCQKVTRPSTRMVKWSLDVCLLATHISVLGDASRLPFHTHLIFHVYICWHIMTLMTHED